MMVEYLCSRGKRHAYSLQVSDDCVRDNNSTVVNTLGAPAMHFAGVDSDAIRLHGRPRKRINHTMIYPTLRPIRPI
ncbi:Hypothetical protein PHPALM_89 [Phytophthora palmivora]|uniref:Uncharacterized protein n=1 Tax=Phytophthora palmivora TaxID=4796 RepID=A0A2P4YVP0_9STRA|nr:Hypothetical protein PHPALM_89 [Phytophthora palmivora]